MSETISLFIKIIVGILLALLLFYGAMWAFFGIIFKLDDNKKKNEAAERFMQEEFSGKVELYDYTEVSGKRRTRIIYIHGEKGTSLSYELDRNNERDKFIETAERAYKHKGQSAVTFVGKSGEEKSFEYPFK